MERGAGIGKGSENDNVEIAAGGGGMVVQELEKKIRTRNETLTEYLT